MAPIPWRNGGGITRELIAFPDPENWRWRISVAEVASDGAFSHFAGVQRWLAILSGTGVRLTTPDGEVELTPQSSVLAFDGATPVQCNLLKGPVQDLNLMLRSGNAASMRHFSGVERIDRDCAKIIAIYANRAPAVVQIDAGAAFLVPAATLAWQYLPAGSVLTSEANSAFLLEIPSK